MQKYIVFDFDGTLVDSQNIFVPIYNQIAEKHGYKTVREERNRVFTQVNDAREM